MRYINKFYKVYKYINIKYKRQFSKSNQAIPFTILAIDLFLNSPKAK